MKGIGWQCIIELNYIAVCYNCQDTKVKQLSSLLTYEDIRSPAMKQTKHIRGVNNLVEEINIIIKEKERNFRLWNMIYNWFAFHVKLLKLKGNASWENTEKNICMTARNLLSKKRFLKVIKRKYSTMDATKKKEVLSQRSEKLVKARSVELCIKQFKRK